VPVVLSHQLSLRLAESFRAAADGLVAIKPMRGQSSPACHSTTATTWRGLFQLCA
jgi:hypothetical protein